MARLETILEHQELSQELKKKPYRKVSLPQQKDTRKKPLPVIVAHGKMYPMVRFGIGKVAKNEDGLTWNQTPDERFRIEVDPNKGVDPMNDQILEDFFPRFEMLRVVSVSLSFLTCLFSRIRKVLAFSTKSGTRRSCAFGLQLGADFGIAPHAQGRQCAMESAVN